MDTNPRARILCWDLETRSLVADYGSIFCIGWQWYGEKELPQVRSIHDIPGKHPLDDGALIRWFVENVWNKADVAVGWYSGGHDEPFLRTRMVIHCDKAPKPVTTLDLWGKVWKRFKFSKNSLDNVSRHLKLPPKWYNPAEDFEKILWGDVAAMRRIKKHCYHDILTTVAAYKRFAPYILTHPRTTHDIKRCRVCGGENLQKRGWKYTAAKGKAIQVWCKKCGSWDTRLPKELE